MNKTTKNVSAKGIPVHDTAASDRCKDRGLLYARYLPLLFFVVIWAMLAFYDYSTLYRLEQQSLFLFDDLFFKETVSVPAGMLSYIGSFLVQFFYYPPLGAAIYVALLFVVYRLTAKAFALPVRYSFLALLPVVLLLATDTQLGYWIFYLKLPGYYYVALTGTIISLLALWLFRNLCPSIQILFVVVWTVAAYPLMGVFALFSSLIMGVCAVVQSLGNRRSLLLSSVTLLVSILSVVFFPLYCYYEVYDNVAKELMYTAGVPSYQWTAELVSKVEHSDTSRWYSIYFYWSPFFMLAASYAALSVSGLFRRKSRGKYLPQILAAATLLSIVAVMYLYWYRDTNFRIENKQDRAMWQENWQEVADLARETELPTRQIVLNKNIALIKKGTAASEMFTYPDGSSDILSPMAVHLTHTGGKMLYFQYGKFNFSYRWCVENAVEYGWRVEFLKHAVRSMLLSGEYDLARRYIKILKRTLFHRSWAEEMEHLADNPELIAEVPEFKVPLSMACYPDALEVDDSFVEMYLSKTFQNFFPEFTKEYLDAAISMSLVRKDSKLFWFLFDKYVRIAAEQGTLPKHYQEAFLLFYNLDKGKTVQIGGDFMERFISPSTKRRLDAFIKKTSQFKGMKESQMAPYFKEEYGDTYFYFYFFVRKIKTN